MREGWKYLKLGEVAFYPNKRILSSEITPENYVGVEQLVKDRGGVIFASEKPNVESAIEYKEQDILIGNIRPYLRKIWLANKRGGASGDIVLVRLKNEYKSLIDETYLYKVLSSDQFFIFDNANTKGAKMPRGDRNCIARYLIPVPPLPEQQRIVSELDLLSSIIDKQKAQLKELDTLCQSIFYDMFGDPVVNEMGWEVKKLGIVCSLKAGKAIKSDELADCNEYPCFGGNGIRGYINKCSHTESAPIIGRQGAYCGTVNFAEAPFYATEHAVVVKALQELDIKWLYHTLIHLKLSRYAKGQAQPGIAVGDLTENVSIPLPPLSDQHLFAQKIQAIESQKAAISSSLAETQKLFDYTMDKYFG